MSQIHHVSGITSQQATAEVQHRNARDEAVDHYTQQMDRLMEETPVPTQLKLGQVHTSLQKEVIEKFRSSRKMGGKELSEKYLRLLEKVSPLIYS